MRTHGETVSIVWDPRTETQSFREKSQIQSPTRPVLWFVCLCFNACSCQIEPVLRINITKSSFATGNGHRWFEMILFRFRCLSHLVSPDFLNILLRTVTPIHSLKSKCVFPPGSWENQEALTGHIFSRRKISSMRSKMVSRRDNLGERKRLGKSGKMMHLMYIYILIPSQFSEGCYCTMNISESFNLFMMEIEHHCLLLRGSLETSALPIDMSDHQQGTWGNDVWVQTLPLSYTTSYHLVSCRYR